MLRLLIKMNSMKKYNKNIFQCVQSLYTTQHRLVEQNTKTVENKHDIKISDIQTKYTTEQENKMLDIINTYSLNQLLGYEITKGRANKLLTWRARKGSLKNLSDIFSVEGFGLKVIDKFFQSLLLEPKPNKKIEKTQSRLSSFITPSLEFEQRESIKSCVSLRIGVNTVTWCRIEMPAQHNVPFLLTDWQIHEISEKKIHLNELIQRCLYFDHFIPRADCYLFENPQVAQASNNPGSVEQQNINIQKAQVTAIMSYALASRSRQLNSIEATPPDARQYMTNVFYLRRFLSARLFNQLVGGERVSSEHIILNMMRRFYNTNEDQNTLKQTDEHSNSRNVNFSHSVQFPEELQKMFSESSPYYREFLSQTLLLNLAFVRLVLLHDPESIAKVSPGNKNK